MSTQGTLDPSILFSPQPFLLLLVLSSIYILFNAFTPSSYRLRSIEGKLLTIHVGYSTIRLQRPNTVELHCSWVSMVRLFIDIVQYNDARADEGEVRIKSMLQPSQVANGR
jgi:hypothetical protein